MSNAIRIELDCTDDSCLVQSGPKEGWLDLFRLTAKVTEAAAEHGVKATLVDEDGPAGCPVFAFVGSPEAVKAYMRVYHNGGLTGPELEEDLDAMIRDFAEPA